MLAIDVVVKSGKADFSKPDDFDGVIVLEDYAVNYSAQDVTGGTPTVCIESIGKRNSSRGDNFSAPVSTVNRTVLIGYLPGFSSSR